jgi:hypothetical protein
MSAPLTEEWMRPTVTCRVSADWTIAVDVERVEGGLIPTIPMAAIHRDGRVERFDVGLWPAGWRILRVDLTIPASVRRDAICIARQCTGIAAGAAA